MINYWKADSYTAAQLEKYMNEKKITIPKYQRGIVWDNKKKDKLIDTIKNGFPFGSILLYQEKETGKLQLIDGLQRSNTIFEFVTNPAKYFSEDDIDEEAINEIYLTTELLGNETAIKEKIKSLLIDWVKTHKTMNDVKSMQFINFSTFLAKEFPSVNDMKKAMKIADLIKPMLKKYHEMCENILTVQIPALIFYGEEDVLPIIFERINSTGAALTKYQIYSATWNNVGIKLVNNELMDILDYVCARYDSMVDGNFEITDYDSTKIRKDKILNAFDLCFGFGKKLVNEFPYLFGNSNDPLKIESIGFTLINSCLGNKFSDLKSLHTNLRKLGDDNVNKLLSKILVCCRHIDKDLSIMTTFKGNTRESNNIHTIHTELQIASIIVSMFILKHVTFHSTDKGEMIVTNYDFEHTSSAWNNCEKDFMKNMKVTYLIDIINENWRGSGDKKLENIRANPDYYRRNIPSDEFEKQFEFWYENIISYRNEEKKVANPNEADRAIMNLIYSSTFSAKDHLDNSKFDIEHILPKAQLKKKLEEYNKNREDDTRVKLPISSIGNLCYLPENINRVKGSKTIYEVDYEPELLKEIENKYTFTSEDDMKWLNEDLEANEFKTRYIIFLKNRCNILKEKIKNILYK